MERVPLNSRSVASVGYEPSKGVLEIEFRSGEVYEYFLVPESAFSELLDAPSAGEYVSNQVRGRYPYRRVR